MKHKQDSKSGSKNKLTVTAVLVEVFSFSGLAMLLYLVAVNWDLVSAEDNNIITGFIHSNWPVYGNKNTLLILGSVAVFFYIVLSLITIWPQFMYYRVEITAYNYRQQYRMMRGLIRWLKLEIILFTLFLAEIFILMSNNLLEEFNPTNILVFIFLIVVTIGIYKHRVKRYNNSGNNRSNSAS